MLGFGVIESSWPWCGSGCNMEDIAPAPDENTKTLWEEDAESPQTFEFVTGKDPDSRKRTRAHVMRDYTRRKKRRERKRLQEMNARSSSGPFISMPASLPQRQKVTGKKVEPDVATIEDTNDPFPLQFTSTQLVPRSSCERSWGE